MKKSSLAVFAFLCLSCFSLVTHAQSLTPTVYSSAGNHYTNGTGQMSYTIGEPFTSTYSGSVVVTQGFHQPDQNGSGIGEHSDFIFSVFPNPSSGQVLIQTTQTSIQEFNLELINNLGQVIASKKINADKTELDISMLAAGTYHLRITYLNNKTNSFTLVKTNQ